MLPPHRRARHHPHRHSLRHYVLAHLHRRLFAWFGLSILVTAVVAALVTMILAHAGPWGFAQEVERGRRFAADQLARVWEDPIARSALLESAARELELDVVLEDAQGQRIASAGRPCERPRFEFEVRRGQALLGRAGVCVEHGRASSPWRTGLVLCSAVAVLWAASGKIARRLTRPLGELVRTVGEIGRGNLSARASISCRAPDEIGVVAEAVNDMASRIEKQLVDQRELLAGVSHELRTPLARIRLVTEMLRSGSGDPKLLGDLDREVVEMDSLVGQLLASSRIEFAAASVRPLLAAEVAARALERAGLELSKLEVEDATLSVSADATLVARALANLLDNAARHGGGLVRLGVRPHGEWVHFEVDDRGPGIPSGAEDEVFSPFNRGGRAGGSLGLGLSLVRRIAQAHGGRAYVTAPEGGGARFVLELPASAPTKGA